MTEPKLSFVSMLRQYLGVAEKVLIVGTAIGLVMKNQGMPGAGDQILTICLSGLAGVFYLVAFAPPLSRDEEPGEEVVENKGFLNLLLGTIVPKVAGIGSAVAVIGILFGILHLSGYKEMLMIGGAASAGAAIMMTIGLATGNEKVKSMMPVYIRVLFLTALCIYLLSQMTF